MEMLKDIGMFDSLCQKNLDYFKQLQIYITAGDEKIKELREQTIPSLLTDKIQTAIQETIPLWKSQMVMALGLYRQQEALKLQRDVTDTTNTLLLKNSGILKQNTLDVAKESERGIVDIETLKKQTRI